MTLLGGRFALEGEIGSGGMSVVYLGRDEILDRPVAVKVLRSAYADSEVGERFRREGRTAARISHPNVVQVYDAQEGAMDGREVSYIVMEHVSGGDLKDEIRKNGPLPEKELCRVGAEVASGLAGAHDRGIIHRDVKPQNILMDDYGRPKITDFGIARAWDTTQATRTGSYLGTATYSSPEQLRGETVTPKSDVYSLGVTLYEAATGEPPFVGGPIEVASQQISKEPPPLRERGAAVSPALEALVMTALSKNPDDRPDAATLSSKLLQEGSTTVAANDPPATDALRKAVGGAGAAGTAGLARAAQAARRIGAAGAAATGEAGRRLRERSAAKESAGWEPPQPVITMQNFHPGRRRALLAAGVLLLLLVVGGIALAVGFGGSEPSGRADSSQGTGGDAAKQNPPDAKAPSPKDEAAASQPAEPSGPPPAAGAAETAVYEMYVSAGAEDDYQASWRLLSNRYQKEVGSVGEWKKRYRDVSYVMFGGANNPRGRVSGNVVEVDFTVELTRSGGTDSVSGKWVVINEGGQPKLDRLIEDG